MDQVNRASGRLLTVVAITLVAAAVAVFAWFGGAALAGAATTPPTQSTTSSQPAANAAPSGRHCAHDGQSSGASGSEQAAPSQPTSSGNQL